MTDRMGATLIERQRLQLMFAQGRVASAVAMLGAVCVALIFACYTINNTASYWLAFVSVATSLRLLLYRYFARSENEQEVGYWLRLHGLTAIGVGVAWGLLPLLAANVTVSYIHELGILIPGFIITATIPSYGVFFSQYAILSAAISLTTAFSRLLADGPLALPEILLFILFLPAPLLTARRLGASLVRSLDSEQRLAAEVTRKQLLFDHSREGIVLLNLEGKIQEASPSFAAMLGYTATEASHLHIRDWDPEWSEARWNCKVQIYGPSGTYETRWHRKDGQIFPVEISHNEIQIEGARYCYWVCRDISERKAAEYALREKEALLQEMSAMAQIGGWQIEVSTGKTAWTEQTARIYEFTGVSNNAFTPGLNIHGDSSRSELEQALDTAINHGVPFDLEFEVTTAAGNHKWVRTMGSPLIENGRVIKVCGALQDITLQKQMTLALNKRRELEMRLAKISESVPGLVCALRLLPDGTLSMPIASLSAEDLFACKPEALQDNLDLIYWNMPTDQARDLYESLLTSSHDLSFWWTDFVFQHPLKGLCWYEARATPVREADGSTLWHTFVMDITDRKRMEVERQRAIHDLADSEERHRLVVDSALDAVVTINSAGVITGWNRQAQRLFGWSREEVLGRSLAETLVPMTSRCDHIQGLGRFLDTGAGPVLNQRIEVSALRRDGSEFPIELSVTPIQMRNNWTFTAFLRDITDRKAAEGELRRHRDRLQELVDERTGDLILAKEAAEQANRIKSEFLANMSHELRTPMHAILSFAGLGNKKLDNVPKEKTAYYFLRIQQSGERLLNLINDLLDLSKLESGQHDMQLNQNDLRIVVDQVISELSLIAQKKELRIIVESTSLSTDAYFDFSKILQVVSNLLANAIKFTPAGKQITLSFHATELPGSTPKGSHDQPALALSVTDQGIGIPEEEMESIFDKFSQSSKTRSDAGGTGLGLSIAREIVGFHDGRLWAERNPEGGARFILVLPRNLACENLRKRVVGAH